MIAGIDIGGTKCAVSLAHHSDERPEVLTKRAFPTPPTPDLSVAELKRTLAGLMKDVADGHLEAIGISCGGPLDSRRGVILSPPKLPGWDEIDILTPFREEFQVPVAVQNDANACALAEWRWGAGRGTNDMVFLTFGTGMGAGLILDGRLYVGATDAAGEVGHIRLAEAGPVGFGKAGSFEGFCSGGGIARMAQTAAREAISTGEPPSFCASVDQLGRVTSATVGAAANAGDPLALDVFQVVGQRLGQGLALLVDILNPERIVIGSIYGRQRVLLEPIVLRVLEREALPASLAACEILPAGLGERVGDFGALAVAMSTG